MTNIALFHPDNAAVFNMDGMRAKARAVILNSRLIKRCLSGDAMAIIALHLGFWYFVSRFEKAIDAQANSTKLPREPLFDKFNRGPTTAVQRRTAVQLRALDNSEFDTVFGKLESEVREMQREEFKHSNIWRVDAKNLGITPEQLEAAYVVPGVRALVKSAYVANDLVAFFAVLAATEFIAEELGFILSPRGSRFTLVFKNERWYWGEVHTIPHGDGPSHLDIDIDLARAYDSASDPARIEALIENAINMFGTAADDVEQHFRTHAMAAD